MNEMEAVELLKSYGFPIVVALWFMFRTEKILKNNTDAINNLINLLQAKM